MKPALALAAFLAACGPAVTPPAPVSAPVSAPASAPAAAPPAARPVEPPVEPRPPGTPGGLPDDRTPISEAPFSPTSAQGAADVVQTYFALIGEKKYAEAWRLWARGGEASGETQADFAAGLGRYIQYAAQIGAPGPVEGAAGSLYVEVPVQIYGRMGTGEAFHRLGPVRLHRVNAVEGSTPEQRLWRIEAMTLKAFD